MAPVIGLTTYREPASWGAWAERADLLAAQYADAVAAKGGIPLLIPPLAGPDEARTLAYRIDGLIVAGGADVNPQRYAAAPEPATTAWRDDRDASEMALLEAAFTADLPVLGICRGMQVMAVLAGGSLLQHVPDTVGHERHSPGAGEYGHTEVAVVPDTQLAGILGAGLTVPCHHHQAVAEHPGYRAAARAADGLLEAFEDPDHAFRIGVQWHPEAGTDLRIFGALVVAAGGRAPRGADPAP